MLTNQPNNDAEPFRKQGNVLDFSELNLMADTNSQALESAIASLKRAGMVKTAELILSQPIEIRTNENNRF